MDSSTSNLWVGQFTGEGVSGSFFLLISYFIEMNAFNANSVDPDQTPRSAASDLGLHFLPISFFMRAIRAQMSQLVSK